MLTVVMLSIIFQSVTNESFILSVIRLNVANKPFMLGRFIPKVLMHPAEYHYGEYHFAEHNK